jgi:hypothetical protein
MEEKVLPPKSPASKLNTYQEESTYMAVDSTVSSSQSSPSWEEIARKLREPFDPQDVDFRVQGRANDQTGRTQVFAYIDARAVQDRLDAVVGAGSWSFDWTPLVVDDGEVKVAKGTLTVYGVSKSDAGSASNFEQTLGAVSHCFKRAAVHWGIGRYLYNLPAIWVTVERGGRIPDAVMRDLRARLPRPEGSDAKAEVVEEEISNGSAERKRPAAAPPPSAPARAPRSVPAEAPRVLPDPPAAGVAEQSATEQQLISIRKLCAALSKPEPAEPLSLMQARALITQLSGEYQRARRAS